MAVEPQNEAHRQRGIFQRPSGSGIWWVYYFDGQGRRRREKAGTRAMANALYRKRKTEVLQGKKLPESMRQRVMQFAELIDGAVEYAREHHQSDRETDYRTPLLRKLFGARPAESITPQDIDRQLSRAAREREWAPATFNRFKAFLSLAFRLGIENGKVTVNPARLVRRKREDNARIRWLSAEEEARLVPIVRQRYPDELPALLLALHTGMRRSEQYRLTWDCVDLDRRQLTIPKTKNGSIRYIPLDESAASALLELRMRSQGIGPVMIAARSGHGYAAGHQLKTPREWFGAACTLAGVADYTWHCNRHTFISRLVMAGVDLRTVQELAGHKTIAMTCRYAHLAPQHQLDAIRRLDGWGQTPPAEPTETATKTATGTFRLIRGRVAGRPQPAMR